MSKEEDSLDPGLQRRLQEAEETLAAIHAGEVDAVVVDGLGGQQVYTLESPDEPFRMFVEQMQEGALTVAVDGTIVYCNRFFADLVGQPLERVRGHSILPFVQDESREDFTSLMEAAAGGIAHGQCKLRTADGEAITVQLALNRLPEEGANRFGIVATDLSARERARRQEVRRQAAEQANAARDQFLAVVSHELRTPLNAILGWTQVLRQRSDLPEALQTGLEVIERNAWSQSQLIDDLLDVSRVLAGKLRLDLRPADLQGVINAAISTMRPTADAKRITLNTELGPEPVTVRGDADRLQQVVWNLLSNAVKFTPEGGEVSVRLRARGTFAEVDVSDKGIGIAAEFLPRLFQLYQQIETPTTRRSGGLGLGLAIVKQLTELHGGEVRAQSDGIGHGATFTIRIPMSTHVATTPSAPLCALSASLLQGVRIVLVDDEIDARQILTQLLESAGAEIVAAVATATEALAAIERNTVDLLLSDIGLPDTDGYELIRRIRATGRSGKDLPAVAVSAFAGREDRREALHAGYQAHISKPVDQNELYAIAKSLTARRTP